MKEVVKSQSNSITDVVTDKIRGWMSSGQLNLPDNYSVENAVKSFYVKLVELDAFNKCTKESVINAFIDLVLQGLSPSKNQAYPIIYNNKLKLHRSYFGSQSVVKRITGAKSIVAVTIHEGDDIEIGIEKGIKTVEHKPKFSTLDNPIIGAYCLIELPNGEVYTEIMTIKEIHASWSQSSAKPFDVKGALKVDSTHYKFPQEMAKRTVINRACKNLVNTSDDSDLVVEAYNRTTEAEFEDVVETTEEIKQKVASTPFREVKSEVEPDRAEPKPEVVAEKPKAKPQPKPIEKEPIVEEEVVEAAWDLDIEELFGDEPAPKGTQDVIKGMTNTMIEKGIPADLIDRACGNQIPSQMSVRDAQASIDALNSLAERHKAKAKK
jgi:recombination protein RecT